MKARHAAVAAGLALGLMSGTAKAAYVFDITQVGNGTVFSGSGSLDLADFSAGNTYSQSNFINPGSSALKIGYQTNSTMYSGSFTYTKSLGSNPDLGFALALGSGAPIGFDALHGFIFVPQNYMGGDLGVSTSTLDDRGLSYFGLTPGTYVFTLNNYPSDIALDDTITVNVSAPSTVPLPASAPMFGAALLALGAVGYGVKRKSKAATAA